MRRSAAGLVVTLVLVVLFHRDEFRDPLPYPTPKPKVHANRVLVMRALGAPVVLVALFLSASGRPRLQSSSALLLTRRVKSRRVYAESRGPGHHRHAPRRAALDIE